MNTTETKINLFVIHYECDKERRKELDFCLNHNRKSGLFSQIVIFESTPTYTDFFIQAAKYPDDINILSNSDIYFNETINLVREMKENECYCITRWEEDNQGNIVRFKDKHAYNKEAKEKYSQDVWVIRGKPRQVYGEFHLGVPGCDNRIAHEFVMAHYKVSNPCERIQCVHRHKDEKRYYKIPERYFKGKVPAPYKFIEPGDEVTHVITRRRSIR